MARWQRPRGYRDYEDGYDFMQGHASGPSSRPDAPEQKRIGNLYVPNPEYLSGWELIIVYAEPEKEIPKGFSWPRPPRAG
jgi:hypothetical protein